MATADKGYMLRVRIREDQRERINQLASDLRATQSEVVRELIDLAEPTGKQRLGLKDHHGGGSPSLD